MQVGTMTRKMSVARPIIFSLCFLLLVASPTHAALTPVSVTGAPTTPTTPTITPTVVSSPKPNLTPIAISPTTSLPLIPTTPTTTPTTGTTTPTGTCNKESDEPVSSEIGCLQYCQAKADKANKKGNTTTIAPKTYVAPSGQLCCVCGYKRIGAPGSAPALAPGQSLPSGTPAPQAGPVYTAPPLDLGIPSKDQNNAPKLPPAQPLTYEQLVALMDTTKTPLPAPGQANLLAVLKVTVGSYYLPLNFDQTASIIYAANNVTSEPWHIMGIVPDTPGQDPPVPPAMGPVLTRTSGRRLNTAETTKDFFTPVELLDEESNDMLYNQPSMKRNRRALKATLVSPSPAGKSPSPVSDYGSSDYGTPSPAPAPKGVAPAKLSPSLSLSPAAKAPAPLAKLSPSGLIAASPTIVRAPSPAFIRPRSPPPAPDYAVVPDYAVPPPAISLIAPPLFAPPPPPPAVPIPEGSTAFWVFMMVPLDPGLQQLVSRALVVSTDPNGKGEFKYNLLIGGLPVQDVELRYVGLGPIDLSKRFTGPLFQQTGPVSTNTTSDDGGGLSAATIGIIVGCVAGGIVLLAAVGAIAAGNRKKKANKQAKESISSKWRLEKELAQSQRKKLAVGTPENPDATMKSTRSMLGGAAADLTPEDMDRNRSARRANTLQAEAILSMKQVEMEQGIVSSSPPKEGKMDRMRSALGLDKKDSKKISKAASKKGGGAQQIQPDLAGGTGATPLYAQTPSSRFTGRSWTVESTTPPPATLDLPTFNFDDDDKKTTKRLFSKK